MLWPGLAVWLCRLRLLRRSMLVGAIVRERRRSRGISPRWPCASPMPSFCSHGDAPVGLCLLAHPALARSGIAGVVLLFCDARQLLLLCIVLREEICKRGHGHRPPGKLCRLLVCARVSCVVAAWPAGGVLYGAHRSRIASCSFAGRVVCATAPSWVVFDAVEPVLRWTFFAACAMPYACRCARFAEVADRLPCRAFVLRFLRSRVLLYRCSPPCFFSASRHSC